MLEKSEKGKKWKKQQSEIQLFTSTSNDPRFAPLLDPDSSPKKWEANSRPNGRPNGRPVGRPVGRPNGRPDGYYSSNIKGTLLVIFFWGKKVGKVGEKCWKNPIKEKIINRVPLILPL